MRLVLSTSLLLALTFTMMISSSKDLHGLAVGSDEASQVYGAVCYKASTEQRYICFGSTGYATASDCTGCGCTKINYPVEVPAGESGVSFNSKAEKCAADVNCTHQKLTGAACGT